MISFIIPAHDEEACLGRSLLELRRVAGVIGEPYEIVVVDDASGDRTGEIAREQGARVVRVECRQIAATRNAGAREALGEIFIFIDADTEPTVEVLRAVLAALQDGAVGGGSGVRFEGKVPLVARIATALLMWGSRLLKLACGCFVFAKREAFEACGGFDETLFAAEEWAVSRRLGRQGCFVVLREQVITSARKLRTFSGWEILGLLLKVALRGPKVLKKREGLELWYGERRVDEGKSE